jgi:hypothetical protein
LEGHHYAFTAGHVIKDARSAHLWTAAGNAKLEPLPYITHFSSQAEDGGLGDIDIGIVPLKSSSLGPFGQCQFLEDVDAEGKVEHQWLDNFYFVMGYPASRNQSATNHRRKKINVKSFHLATSTPPKLQGVSGGGIFCIWRSSNTGPLVAIATEHRKQSCTLVGTRVRSFVQVARELARTEPPEIFE